MDPSAYERGWRAGYDAAVEDRLAKATLAADRAVSNRSPYPAISPQPEKERASRPYPEHGAGSPPDADSFPDKEHTAMRDRVPPFDSIVPLKAETTNTNAYRHSSIMERLDRIVNLLNRINENQLEAARVPTAADQFYPIYPTSTGC